MDIESIIEEYKAEAQAFVDFHMDVREKLVTENKTLADLQQRAAAATQLLTEHQDLIIEESADPRSPPMGYRVVFYVQVIERLKTQCMVSETRIERLNAIIDGMESDFLQY